MPREVCLACRRPSDSCLCPKLAPMECRTHVVLLMHPKEWRRTKCNTGRITCLNLRNSEIIVGVGFDEDARVRALIDEPDNFPLLLYPGEGATNLSQVGFPSSLTEGRRLVVFLVDATWPCSRVIIRSSPGLLQLPRIMFTPKEKSRWVIKRQPADYCLSTLESVHELLLALESAGLDTYPDKTRLLDAFERMQTYQLKRASAAAAGTGTRRQVS